MTVSAPSAPQGKTDRQPSETTELSRIMFQFWLIVVAMIATVVVASFTLWIFSSHLPNNAPTGDIVAIITAITGFFVTFLAGYSGVQAVNAASRHSSEQMAAQSTAFLQSIRGELTQAPFMTIAPSCGPHEGNTRVIIQGSNFTGASAVNFGEYVGTNLEVKNDGLIYVTTPAVGHAIDSTDVTIVFPDPAKPSVRAGTFFYYTLGKDPNGELVIEGCASGFKGITGVAVGEKVQTNYAMRDERHLVVHGVHPDGRSGHPADVVLVYEADTPLNRYQVGVVNVSDRD